jgi:hypothetical protein
MKLMLALLVMSWTLMLPTTLVHAEGMPQPCGLSAAVVQQPSAGCCGVMGLCQISAVMEEMPTASISSSLCDLRAFSPDTRFMSLAGFERWQHRQLFGRWQPLELAERRVQQQLALCPIR